MTTIKTHPELNRLALKEKLDTPYIVWVVLRHEISQQNLSGHYTKKDVRKLSASHGLNFTTRHWKRIIKAGENVFWGNSYGHLHIRSLKRVFTRLADDNARLEPQFDYVRIEIHKQSAMRRATLYHSWFMNRGEVTISRATLQDLFGLTPDTQRSYERLLGKNMLVKSNYCHIDADLFKKSPRNLPQHAYTFEHEVFENNKVYTRTEIAYQMPNTFIARSLVSGESPKTSAPRKALQVARTQYGTTQHSYNKQRYYRHFDLWQENSDSTAYFRTYYQGKKRINRIGHYI